MKTPGTLWKFSSTTTETRCISSILFTVFLKSANKKGTREKKVCYSCWFGLSFFGDLTSLTSFGRWWRTPFLQPLCWLVSPGKCDINSNHNVRLWNWIKWLSMTQSRLLPYYFLPYWFLNIIKVHLRLSRLEGLDETVVNMPRQRRPPNPILPRFFIGSSYYQYPFSGIILKIDSSWIHNSNRSNQDYPFNIHFIEFNYVVL